MAIFNLPSSLSFPKFTRVTQTALSVVTSGNVSPPLDLDASRAFFTIYNASSIDVYIDFSTDTNPTAPSLTGCSYVLKPKSTYVADFLYYTGKVPLASASGTASVIVRAFYET